jgi:drug/metabolite transporter (DMT)-like permease
VTNFFPQNNKLTSVSNTSLGIIFTLVATLGYASKTILAKIIYSYGIEPITLIALRMIIAGSIFLSILTFNTLRGAWVLSLNPKQWGTIVILGIFGYYLCTFLDFAGLYYIDGSLERMILFLYPTLVVVLNSAFNKIKILPITKLSLIVCYLGIILMFNPNIDQNDSTNLFKGSLLVFLAAIVYAFYLFGVDRYFKKVKMTFFISITMCVCTLAVMTHFFIIRDFSSLLHLDYHIYIYVSFLSLFCTVVPVYFMSLGIAYLGASKAASYNLVGPIVTLILSVIILKEILSPSEIFGAILIISGVSLIR